MIAAALFLGLLLAPGDATRSPSPARMAEALDAAEREISGALESDEQEEWSRADDRALLRARESLAEAGGGWLSSDLPSPDASSRSRRRAGLQVTLDRVRAARATLHEAERVAGEEPNGEAQERPGAPPPHAARDVLRDVLKERQFRPADEADPEAPEGIEAVGGYWQRFSNWVQSFFAKKPQDDEPSWVWQWVKDALSPLEDVFKFLGKLPWTEIGQAFLALLALGLLALAWRYLSGASLPLLGAPGGGSNPLVLDALRRDAAEHLRDGDRLLERGDTRGAVRAYYTGILSALHRRRLLELEPSLTNWEHVKKLRYQQEIELLVTPPTRTFDDAWYGRLAVDRERVLDVARALTTLDPEAEAARAGELSKGGRAPDGPRAPGGGP